MRLKKNLKKKLKLKLKLKEKEKEKLKKLRSYLISWTTTCLLESFLCFETNCGFSKDVIGGWAWLNQGQEHVAQTVLVFCLEVTEGCCLVGLLGESNNCQQLPQVQYTSGDP